MADHIIKTQGLTREFKSTRAVEKLNIEVPKGIVFGFLGPNGSGKTTTIRMLLGLLEPTSGKAEVLGFDTVKHPDNIRLQCGALLEHPGVYERLSAEDNLQLYARIWKMSDVEGRTRIKELLESFGLWDRRKDPAGTWSHGMKKKLAVARAMLHRPALLFLDEPSAGLDPVAAAGLREELASVVRREGVTVFLTTHNFPSFVLVQLLSGLMADSFAGERERHTLETLLASRLSDLAILIGKMVAGVLLVWGLMLFTMGLGTLSAYLRSNGERLPISAGGVGAVLVIYLLVCCVVSCAAVLVSLRASTVRQAMQTLTWSFMIVFFAVIFTIARLSVSPEWRVTFLRTLAGEHLLRTEMIAGATLAGLALLLFGAARLRFQRARLILD